MEEVSRAYSMHMTGGSVIVYGGVLEKNIEPRIKDIFTGGIDLDGILAEVSEGGCEIEGCYDGLHTEDETAPLGDYDFVTDPMGDYAFNETPTGIEEALGDYNFELD